MGEKGKKPGKIGSLSSPIFYFAHADFFSPFPPMQSLMPGYGGGGDDPSVVCISSFFSAVSLYFVLISLVVI